MDPRFTSWAAAAIKRWGPYYGVTISPAHVMGIIQRESIGGKVLEVREPNGTTSWGPMGINDLVAIDLGVSPASTFRDKPQLGIWYGVKWFASLLKKFNGDVARALSAYNAGSGNAVRNPATGRFPNQAYVDFVLKYAGAGSVVMVGIALVVGLLALRSRKAA